MSGYLTAADMPAAELEALQSYAKEHGRRWKSELGLDWYHARAIGERGTILHGLRNSPRFGSEGLERFRLPKPAKTGEAA
jgi:hypothetical protein